MTNQTDDKWYADLREWVDWQLDRYAKHWAQVTNQKQTDDDPWRQWCEDNGVSLTSIAHPPASFWTKIWCWWRIVTFRFRAYKVLRNTEIELDDERN